MSERRLYEVEVTKTLYVVATSRREAEETAIYHLSEEDWPPTAFAHEMWHGERVPPEVAHSLPWIAASIEDEPERPVEHYLALHSEEESDG